MDDLNRIKLLIEYNSHSNSQPLTESYLNQLIVEGKIDDIYEKFYKEKISSRDIFDRLFNIVCR